jgi:hypothetical protein
VPQLWISQTTKLIRAYHSNGLFQVPEAEDVKDEIKAWESRNQRDLRLLAGLIKTTRDQVQLKRVTAVLRYDAEADKLVISPQNKRLLPEDLYSSWTVESGFVGNIASDVEQAMALPDNSRE